MVVLCLAATYLIVTHSVGWVRGRDELVAPRSLRTSTKIFLDISDHFLSLSQPSQESTLILNRDKELIPVPQRATKNFYSSEIMNTRMRASRTGSFGPQKPPPTGIARLCDIAILKKDYTLFNKPLEEARTIFVLAAIQLDGIRALKALLDRMQPEHKKVVVVVACGDSTFPNSADARDRGFNAAQRQEMLQVIDHPMILSMFVENLDERVHPGRVHSLPLGLNPMEGPIVMKYYMDTLQSIIVETTATTAATATKANGTVVANGSSSGGADSLTSLSESTEPSAHIRRSPSRARAIQKGGVAHPHAHAHAHPIIGMISGSSSSSNNYDNNNSNSDSSVSSNSSSRGSGVDSPTQLDEFLREFFYSRPLKFTNYNREHRGEQFQERRIVHELAQRAPWKEFCTAHPKPSLLQVSTKVVYAGRIKHFFNVKGISFEIIF